MMPIELREPITLDDLRKAIERFAGYPVATLRAHHSDSSIVRTVFMDGEHLDVKVSADLTIQNGRVIATVRIMPFDHWDREDQATV
jgi:hypothetical protein